jgi:hypothetical protein
MTKKVTFHHTPYKANLNLSDAQRLAHAPIPPLLTMPGKVRFDSVAIGNIVEGNIAEGNIAGTVDEFHMQSTVKWYDPRTWRNKPIKVIEEFTLTSISLGRRI